jgi:hypothetical protein
MSPARQVSLTPAKLSRGDKRQIRSSASRQTRRRIRSSAMPSLTRRAALALLPITLLPAVAWAETCPEALPGLRLCDVWGWARETAADGVITLTHATGITATITFKTGLDAEAEGWARWQQSHAPISARATVLESGFGEIDGRMASWGAWQPRYLDAPTLVVMTGYVGEGMALQVVTRALGDHYDDTHRAAHDGLCAAIRLDPPA